MEYTNLNQYGFEAQFRHEAELYPGLHPARVTGQNRQFYRVMSEGGELIATVSGKFVHEAAGTEDFPAVGDWVMLDTGETPGGQAVIRRLLARKSAFFRKAAGTAEGIQIVAANIDIVFLCMSLNENFNLRRLERYLSAAWSSGATPVVVLTKADLCAAVPDRIAEASASAPGAEILLCSVLSEDGFASVSRRIEPGMTAAFLGSSGVGKSTLINRLLGSDSFATRAVREDGRGRHTTTSRELALLPGGGMVIDTPGMRELHLGSGDLDRSFGDIDALSEDCRFRDCTHTAEPGCAVRQAVMDGTLSQARMESYFKLRRELSYEGLDSRSRDEEKLRRMFGSKGEMKQAMQYAKNKRK